MIYLMGANFSKKCNMVKKFIIYRNKLINKIYFLIFEEKIGVSIQIYIII